MSPYTSQIPSNLRSTQERVWHVRSRVPCCEQSHPEMQGWAGPGSGVGRSAHAALSACTKPALHPPSPRNRPLFPPTQVDLWILSTHPHHRSWPAGGLDVGRKEGRVFVGNLHIRHLWLETRKEIDTLNIQYFVNTWAGEYMRGEALSPSGSSVALRCQAGGTQWLGGRVVTGKGEMPCLTNTQVNAVFKQVLPALPTRLWKNLVWSSPWGASGNA